MVFQFVSLYPASQRAREHRLPARGRAAKQGRRSRAKIEWMTKVFALGDILAPTARRPAARRPPEGGARTRRRARAVRAPARRAALRHRRAVPRGDALGAPAHPEGARHDDGPCHPRPARGDVARRPRRADARRPHRPGRARPPSFSRIRSTSSPAFFIGSPSVNLIDAELDGGSLLLGARPVADPPPGAARGTARRGVRGSGSGPPARRHARPTRASHFAVPGRLRRRPGRRPRAHFDVELGGGAGRA